VAALTDTCYLCGRPVAGDCSRDHIPPLQFFPPSVRQQVNLAKLVTLPAHPECNRAYGLDEEYFVWSLSPLAVDSTAGRAMMGDIAKKFRSGRNVPLGNKVLREFVARPSGLILPHGKIIKRLDGARIKRVVWKIVRGLYFLENGEVLPEATTFSVESIGPHEEEDSDLSELWEHVKAQPSKAEYRGVFDYKYLDAQADSVRVHAWGMLLWDRIMVFVGHWHPGEQAEAAT